MKEDPPPVDSRTDHESDAEAASPRHLPEIAAAFLKLGCISFGGPVAHLGYFHEEFVRRRRWIREATFADLMALCQFLPGPASSQLVFALGLRRGGLAGALLASLGFTLPSAVLMIAFGYGVSTLDHLSNAGWLHGLKLAAVAVVAQAVWGMGVRLCPDRARLTLALVAAAIVLLVPHALGQIGVILGGAIAGWWRYRHEPAATAPAADHALSRRHGWAAGALLAWAVLLAILPAVAAAMRTDGIRLFDAFYRAGSLVFGGGHVVLPLLRAEVVPPGWVEDGTFLAGYGAAQALPGPLFTFAAYLGTINETSLHGWIGGLWCVFALFLPGWLLIGGTLPFWNLLRTRTWTQGAMRGANAAVVGVLLAALYNPVWREGVTRPADVAAALGAFLLLHSWKVPPWLAVALMAALGQWLL